MPQAMEQGQQMFCFSRSRHVDSSQVALGFSFHMLLSGAWRTSCPATGGRWQRTSPAAISTAQWCRCWASASSACWTAAPGARDRNGGSPIPPWCGSRNGCTLSLSTASRPARRWPPVPLTCHPLGGQDRGRVPRSSRHDWHGLILGGRAL